MMSLRGGPQGPTKQSRGLLLLFVFWLVAWIWPSGLLRPFPEGTTSWRARNDRQGILGPLTLTEKILLGYPLSFQKMSVKDWEMIPRIGPALAKRIVAYQATNGPVVELEDLDRIPGIGPKTIEGLRQFFDTSKP